MSITFNRNELFRFERLVTKVGVTKNRPKLNVHFLPGPQGLTLLIVDHQFSLAFDIVTASFNTPFSLSWENVKELAAKPEGEIRFDLIPDKAITTWTIKGVPQQKPLDRQDVDGAAPALPETCLPIHQGYFDALVNAARCADNENTRYALGGAALVGDKSHIVATNGRILLLQKGFTFPWTETVICQLPKLFGSKELRDLGKEPQIGCADNHVFIASGPMKLWLRQIDGKFPNYERIIPDTEGFTKISLDAKDAKFVIDRIETLPVSDPHQGVCFGVENGVFVRSHDPVNETATELQLAHSTYSGADTKGKCNRTFLKEAFQLGCMELALDKDSPMVARRENAVFVWMPLSDDEPVIDRSKVLVCSSAAGAAMPAVKPAATPVSIPSVSEEVFDVEPVNSACTLDKAFTASVLVPKTAQTTKPKATTERGRQPKSTQAKPGTISAMLEKAERVRESMRAALSDQNELIRELRTHKSAARKRDQKLKATVAELKNFQTV